MAPESERTMRCEFQRIGEHMRCEREAGHVGAHVCHGANCGCADCTRKDWTPEPNEPTLTCSEVVERLPSEPCPACGDRNRCPSCKHHEGNPHDATCRAFRAQLKKFIHDSCRQIPDDDGSISDLAAALVKQYPGILHSWRERRVQELEEALRTIAAWPFDIMGDCVADAKNLAKRALGSDHSWPCPHCGKPLYDSGDHGIIHVHQADQCGNSEWREQIRKGGKHD